MRQTPTTSLPEGLRRELDELCSETGVPRNRVVCESPAAHLFVRRFRGLQSAMAANASAKGVYADEDVFREIS